MIFMRVAYLDCFAGISGDMFLGALIDAGVDVGVLHAAAAALRIGASLQVERVDRSGVTATKVHVLEAGLPAEIPHYEFDETEEALKKEHAREATTSHQQAEVFGDQIRREGEPLSQQPKTQHLHRSGHHQQHQHAGGLMENTEWKVVETDEQAHGSERSLTMIRSLIEGSDLASPVKAFAIQTFTLLGTSEARIHNVPIDQIHFHEVGAVDAIVDIVLAAAGVHQLNTQAIATTGEPLRWHSSPINVGGGMVRCAHGRFPVPAPATADLLLGMPTYSATMKKELVTPTGAAILKALKPTFGDQPAMTVEAIGYGAGTRNPEGFPNVLRLSLGEGGSNTPARGISPGTVIVIETAVDDLSPQILAHVTERALELGALDVMCTAVQMKKGRMGTLVTLLSDEAHVPALEQLLLRETSTLGVRLRTDSRSCLERSHETVQTRYGEIRIKVGRLRGEELNAAPEFEDCRRAAGEYGVPVKLVMQSALAAYAAVRGSK